MRSRALPIVADTFPDQATRQTEPPALSRLQTDVTAIQNS
jgi:hypothetical protein